MNIFEVIWVALALCVDSFAVSAAGGCSNCKIPVGNKLFGAVIFAACQGGLTLAGWFAGDSALSLFESVLRVAAFILLFGIGAKMCFDAFKGENVRRRNFLNPLNVKLAFVLGIATSIDALALGVSFAFVGANIFAAAFIISAVTFFACLLGMELGRSAARVSKRLPAFGGVVLIVIALLMLADVG